MAYNKDIVEKLSQFNCMTFTKKQWDIILKGCGCPKSAFFWSALREHNLVKHSNLYTLWSINNNTFSQIWEKYCTANRNSVNKTNMKKKAKEQARKRTESLKGTIFYMVGGVLTTEIPQRDI